MVGEFKIMGDKCYLQVNNSGTLKKLPKLKWWQIICLAFKNTFKGYVDIDDVENFVKKNNNK